MVNRGRPSRDCRPCRKRKLRCDLQRDKCGQCRRANIACFGWPDPRALIIRDETASARQKVLSRHSNCNALPTSLSPSWQVRARHAFFAYYVFGFSRSHDALAQLYAAASVDSVLSAAVDAAALAFMVKHHQAPGSVIETRSAPVRPTALGRLATESYTASIRRLSSIMNAAMQPTSAAGATGSGVEQLHDDATLQAVLLLDLYEKLAHVGSRPGRAPRPHDTISSSDHPGDGPWMSHLRGALDLVRARGPHRRYSSPTARRLTARLAMTVVISCAVAGVHVPAELQELRMGLLPYLGTPSLSEDRVTKVWNADWVDPKFAATGLVIGVVNLAADVSLGTTTASEVVRLATKLDGQLVEMERGLPPPWQSERKYTSTDSKIVYAGYYDTYTDHFVAQVRNVIRSMRLLLADLACKHCLPCWDPADDPCGTSVSALVRDLCCDICASVPQFVWPEARSDNRIPFTPLQTLQCYTLLSPLYLAGKLSPQLGMRTWVIAILKYMADCGGMRAAKTVADILLYAPQVSYWQIYAMLGSYAFAA
ncbi:hypothetical protein FJTKL_08330 [Diaporthe vaccinii]|uniref:Zn(2)-C6 fungal-type domain-containing protein n=1 Tax=Diaporthe vaccinii TaxID=105482 RepID=A0ABR4ES37_9PEZI